MVDECFNKEAVLVDDVLAVVREGNALSARCRRSSRIRTDGGASSVTEMRSVGSVYLRLVKGAMASGTTVKARHVTGSRVCRSLSPLDISMLSEL